MTRHACSNAECPICRVGDPNSPPCGKHWWCWAPRGHEGDCLRGRDVLKNLGAALVLRLIDGKRHHERS